MALKEGRCPNCGSILMLIPEQEKGHCLYCDAVFDNAKAFALAQDAQDYVFPNEEQPKYTGPNLDPSEYQPRFNVESFEQKIAANKTKQTTSKQATEELQLSAEAVPELKLTPRQITITAGAFVLAFAIFFAVMIPVSAERDRVREYLKDQFFAHVEREIEPEAFLIRGNDNGQVVLYLPQKPSKEEASALYEQYCQDRAVALELESNAVYKGVGMEIISHEGVWSFKAADGENGEAYRVQEL